MKRAAAEALAGGRAMRWLARLPAWRGTLTLAYHRILADDGDEMPYGPWVFSATSRTLEAQMAFISTRFEVVPPNSIAEDPTTRGRRIAVTFDDGYRDNYELALPVLRRYEIPAGFFLATGFLDRPRVPWWDQLAWMSLQSRHATINLEPWGAGELDLQRDPAGVVRTLTRTYKTLPTTNATEFLEECSKLTEVELLDEDAASDLWMTWRMARELRDAGMLIGGHTANHPVLGRCDPAVQREEILECRERLADELGVKMRWFAYPVGRPESFNDRTRELLAEVGVELAFSLYGGYMRPGRFDRLDVLRASVSMETTEPAFRAMLAFPGAFARW